MKEAFPEAVSKPLGSKRTDSMGEFRAGVDLEGEGEGYQK